MLKEKLWVLDSSKWGVFLCLRTVCLCMSLCVCVSLCASGCVYRYVCVGVSLCLYDYISVYVLCLFVYL